jgi:hypothetical protein
MFNFFKRKDKISQVDTTEKNPFLFFGATIDKNIVQTTFPRLHKNVKINSNAVQQFVSASLQFDIDNDKVLMMQTVKPEYEKFLADQDYFGHFWQFYSLFKKYYDGDPSLDTALRNVAVYFLEHCCAIPKPYSMLHPDLILKTNIIMTEIWKYLKTELKAEWVQKEIFVDGEIETE